MPVMFSDFAYGDFINKALPPVMRDLANAISERELAVHNSYAHDVPDLWALPNDASGATPVVEDFIPVGNSYFSYFGLRRHAIVTSYGAYFIATARQRIEYLAGVSSGSSHTPGNVYDQYAFYVKSDFTPWTSRADFIGDAGYGDEWISDVEVHNPEIWYQLREAVRLLRWYKIQVRTIPQSLGTPPTSYHGVACPTNKWIYGSSTNPSIIMSQANNVWGGVIDKFNNPTTFFDPLTYPNFATELTVAGIGFAIKGTPHGFYSIGSTSVFGRLMFAYYSPIARFKLGYLELFRGSIITPWEWQWRARLTDAASIPEAESPDRITFENDMGDTIQLGPLAQDEAFVFEHVDADAPLGAEKIFEWRISDPDNPPASPFPEAAYAVGSGGFYNAAELILDDGSFYPGESLPIITMRCDAQPAFDFV